MHLLGKGESDTLQAGFHRHPKKTQHTLCLINECRVTSSVYITYEIKLVHSFSKLYHKPALRDAYFFHAVSKNAMNAFPTEDITQQASLFAAPYLLNERIKQDKSLMSNVYLFGTVNPTPSPGHVCERTSFIPFVR